MCALVRLLKTHLYCLVGCLSMFVSPHTVLGFLYACVYIFPFAIEHVSNGKAL